jgi:molecular chaperone GrpE
MWSRRTGGSGGPGEGQGGGAGGEARDADRSRKPEGARSPASERDDAAMNPSNHAQHDAPHDSGRDAADGPMDLGDIGVYEQTIAKLQEDKAELNERLLRTLADYQNSQRRAVNNEREAKQQGIVSVVSNVLTVLDHFDLALQQDPSKSSAQQIIEGVRVIRDELVRVLANHGVAQLAPEANDEFDPMRHEALMQQMAEGIEPGRIVSTLQPGYVLQSSAGERVLRSAKVIVRPG